MQKNVNDNNDVTYCIISGSLKKCLTLNRQQRNILRIYLLTKQDKTKLL